MKQQSVLLQQQNMVLNETLSRLDESIKNLYGPGGGNRDRYATQNKQKLFDPYPGDQKSFNKDQTAFSLVECLYCHETGHWACPKTENQDKVSTSANRLN